MLNFLSTDTEKILTNDYVNAKKLQDKTLEQIKEEYKFDEIKDAFDEGNKTPQLDLFFRGDNNNFVQACNFLSLNEDNNEFVFFLCSDVGQNIMTNNNLSIHVETGNMFYNDFTLMKIFTAFY